MPNNEVGNLSAKDELENPNKNKTNMMSVFSYQTFVPHLHEGQSKEITKK